MANGVANGAANELRYPRPKSFERFVLVCARSLSLYEITNLCRSKKMGSLNRHLVVAQEESCESLPEGCFGSGLEPLAEHAAKHHVCISVLVEQCDPTCECVCCGGCG